MGTTRCAAIDLGASSGRVVVAETDGDRISLRETARFPTPLVRDASGHQCWDLAAMEANVREGLRAAIASTGVASVGVDAWGVDFVLLDAAGELAAPAVSYRDERTKAAMPAVLERMPATEIYRRTGIQFLALNTLYQLAATAASHPEWLRRARRLLMVPDWFHFRLCGARTNEYTEATTTQLWGIDSHDWDDDLLALAGVPRTLLDRPVEPGTVLGDLAPPSPGAGGVKVIAPATHDTASSVAAIPLQGPDDVYISSGTWSLMGFESRTPVATEAARRLNVTNEGGVERRYRVLKNIAGLWVAERIRAELGIARAAELVEAARAAEPWRSLIDPDAPSFFNPPSMVEAVRGFCAATGQPVPDGAGALARCAFESLALSYRSVARELASLRERPVSRVHIVGGGSRNELLDQLCADACELPVRAGPAETSALGNACVQLMGLGALPSLDAIRALVGRSYAVAEYAPRDRVPDDALRRFDAFRGEHPIGQ